MLRCIGAMPMQCMRLAPRCSAGSALAVAARSRPPPPGATTQDVLVVTAPGSGAEIIPFLKTWVNLPMAIGFTILYAKVGLLCCPGI